MFLIGYADDCRSGCIHLKFHSLRFFSRKKSRHHHWSNRSRCPLHSQIHYINKIQKIIGHPYSFVCGYEAGYLGSIFSINFSRFITNAWKWLLDASIRDLNCGMIILIDSLKIVCCMCVVCLLFFVL